MKPYPNPTTKKKQLLQKKILQQLQIPQPLHQIHNKFHANNVNMNININYNTIDHQVIDKQVEVYNRKNLRKDMKYQEERHMDAFLKQYQQRKNKYNRNQTHRNSQERVSNQYNNMQYDNTKHNNTKHDSIKHDSRNYQQIYKSKRRYSNQKVQKSTQLRRSLPSKQKARLIMKPHDQSQAQRSYPRPYYQSLQPYNPQISKAHKTQANLDNSLNTIKKPYHKLLTQQNQPQLYEPKFQVMTKTSNKDFCRIRNNIKSMEKKDTVQTRTPLKRNANYRYKDNQDDMMHNYQSLGKTQYVRRNQSKTNPSSINKRYSFKQSSKKLSHNINYQYDQQYLVKQIQILDLRIKQFSQFFQLNDKINGILQDKMINQIQNGLKELTNNKRYQRDDKSQQKPNDKSKLIQKQLINQQIQTKYFQNNKILSQLLKIHKILIQNKSQSQQFILFSQQFLQLLKNPITLSKQQQLFLMIKRSCSTFQTKFISQIDKGVIGRFYRLFVNWVGGIMKFWELVTFKHYMQNTQINGDKGVCQFFTLIKIMQSLDINYQPFQTTLILQAANILNNYQKQTMLKNVATSQKHIKQQETPFLQNLPILTHILQIIPERIPTQNQSQIIKLINKRVQYIELMNEFLLSCKDKYQKVKEDCQLEIIGIIQGQYTLQRQNYEDYIYKRAWKSLYDKEIAYRKLCYYNHKDIICEDEKSSLACLLKEYTEPLVKQNILLKQWHAIPNPPDRFLLALCPHVISLPYLIHNYTKNFTFLQSYNLFLSQKYSQSYMSLQQLIGKLQSPLLEKALGLMVLNKIKMNLFYQAIDLINRMGYYGVAIEDPKQGKYIWAKHAELVLIKFFCQGVVQVMKRKLEEGIITLQKVRTLLSSNASICKQPEFTTQLPYFLPLLIPHLTQLILPFLSFPYYCSNQPQFAHQYLIQHLNLPNPPQHLSTIVRYNLLLCKGLIFMKERKYQQAIGVYKQAIMAVERTEPMVYVAIALYRIYMALSKEQRIKHTNAKAQSLLTQIQAILSRGIILCAQICTNFSSSIYHLRSLFYSSLGLFPVALLDISQAIQRSQQNNPSHFYLKSLILACTQNYSQAINQATICIQLNVDYGEVYLLRSKCYQIEGEQERAFLDLQTYIQIQKGDKRVHRYAGHLLFQNGAFQDALLAYQQGEVEGEQDDDFHVYLTKAKTYFLLGRFQEAHIQMVKSAETRPDQPELKFDAEMLLLTNQIITSINMQQSAQRKSLLQCHLCKLTCLYRSQPSVGKIFKLPQLHLLSFLLNFYLSQYQACTSHLYSCIKLKSFTSNQQKQMFQEEENQKRMFVMHMYYNLGVLQVVKGDGVKALKELGKCAVKEGSRSYDAYREFIDQLTGKQKILPNRYYPQVFTTKNKLSQFIPPVTISTSMSASRQLTFCIPYPKVQPPQINPTFPVSLLQSFSQDLIQKKPQAPWIINQGNSIKFTEQIKTYSRLNLNHSQVNSQKKHKYLTLCDKQSSQDEQKSIRASILKRIQSRDRQIHQQTLKGRYKTQISQRNVQNKWIARKQI